MKLRDIWAFSANRTVVNRAINQGKFRLQITKEQSALGSTGK